MFSKQIELSLPSVILNSFCFDMIIAVVILLEITFAFSELVHWFDYDLSIKNHAEFIGKSVYRAFSNPDPSEIDVIHQVLKAVLEISMGKYAE